jgi:putative ABC transport system permease protein
MSIPLSYNIRNLIVRKTTTIMTALGIALTVAVLLAILAMVDGLRVMLGSSGDPRHVMVLRKGSDSEIVSNFGRATFQDIKFKPGIAAGRDGQPLASLEMVTVINLVSVDNPSGSNVTIRGLQPAGMELRSNVRLADGRWFDQGKREIVVGRAVAQRFPDAQIGKSLNFARGSWTIVGVMECGRCAVDSEVWGDVNQIAADFQRTEVLSAAMLEATDAVTAKALINDIDHDQRLNMHALTEKEYMELQTISGEPIRFVGMFVAIIMAVGSAFAAMNTMYAAVARRAREIGTLRVLGFSRGSILLSFFAESVLLAGLGGLLGCLLVMPLNGLTTAVGNSNFAEMAFDLRVSPRLMAIGVGFAAILGCVGGLFPARNASRKEILTALREV